jgi:5'-AMP-activated protein kinase catalytic alpha subunit
MEFAKGGELFNHIVKQKRLDESEAAFYFTQIICGLEVIHKNNIVHRDIKPENLLLKENNILTIIDFGLSNQYKQGKTLSTPCGSPCYAAPEMILGRKYNGLMVDLWSSGIVLYAMVCGYLPFEDKNNDKLYKKILNGKFEIPEHLSMECRDLLKKILTVSPKKRINLEDIKSHPFLALASPTYKVDESTINREKGVYNEIIIDKMVNGMPGYDFRKDEILFHLSHNKHNNITTTYELLLKKCLTNILPKINIDATTLTIANKPLRKKFNVMNLNPHLMKVNSFIK